MRNLRNLLACTAACCLVVSPAFAGRSAAIEKFEGETGLAKLDAVANAITSAASYKGQFGNTLKWVMEKSKDGEIVATFFERSYMAKVTIAYDKEKYSISYKDSTNLNYDGKTIHPSYNKWVATLKASIDRAIAQARAEAADKK